MVFVSMYVGQFFLRVSALLLSTSLFVGCLSRKKDQATGPVESPPPAAYPESEAAYADTNSPPPATPPAPYQTAAASEPEPFELRPDEELVSHRIESGENLSVIASKYNSSIRRIQAANGMSGTTIYAGKTIQVPAKKAAGLATASSPSIAPAPPVTPSTPAPATSAGGRFGASAPPAYHGPAGGDYVSNNTTSGAIAPPPVEAKPDPAATSYPRVTSPTAPATPPVPEESFPTPSFGGSRIQFSD